MLTERFHDAIFSARCRLAESIRSIAAGLINLARRIQPEPCWYVEGRWGEDDREAS